MNFSRLQIDFNQKIPQDIYIESTVYHSEPLVSQKFSEIVSNDIIKLNLLNSEFDDISSLKFTANVEFSPKIGYNMSSNNNRFYCMYQPEDMNNNRSKWKFLESPAPQIKMNNSTTSLICLTTHFSFFAIIEEGFNSNSSFAVSSKNSEEKKFYEEI